jgi:drug/metabolite transporter (DMT)-like permease
MDRFSDAYYGTVLAFIASVFWTFSPVFFSAAGRRIGSYNVNILRLGLAAVLLCFVLGGYIFAINGMRLLLVPLPAALWLILSGIAGLVAGDMFYLKSLATLGPRRTTQLITLAPIVPVVIAWVALGERLKWPVVCGIAMILAGLIYTGMHDTVKPPAGSAEPGKFSGKGLMIGIIGAFFQGLGAVLARQAYLSAPAMDPLVATTIRIGSSAVILWIIAACMGRLPGAFAAFRRRDAAVRVVLGTLAGPTIGMVFYVASFKYAPAGIASTMSSLSPLLILPVIAVRYKARIRKEALAGTVLAICGIAAIALIK